MTDDLIERLSMQAAQESKISRQMAEEKSRRQPGNPTGECVYMWAKPEQTVSWQAADEIERLRAMIANPPKHNFWGAGEADCPRDIKAGNGELFKLRCKVCGLDNPRDDICRAELAA